MFIHFKTTKNKPQEPQNNDFIHYFIVKLEIKINCEKLLGHTTSPRLWSNGGTHCGKLNVAYPVGSTRATNTKAIDGETTDSINHLEFAHQWEF